MREETENVIISKLKNKENFNPVGINNFKSEKEFQIWLGRELVKIGFEVYTDKKICELSAFHGDKEKPDLLVFYKNFYKQNKVIEFKSPLAIETKFVGKRNIFNSLSHSILQIKKYHKKIYNTSNWQGEIINILLTTNDFLFKNKIYDWRIATELGLNDISFHYGIYWALIRILSTISNKSGLIGWDGEHFVIETPNSDFYLLKGGFIGYKPNQWNNNGRGYNYT